MCILTTGQFRLKKYSRDLANWADAGSEIETVTISVLRFGTREQTKITSMFVRANESDDRAHFSASAVSKIEICRKLWRLQTLIENIVNDNDHAWPRTMNWQFVGSLFRASGNFSFVIGMSLRVASTRVPRANPCFYTSQYEGTRDSRTWKRRNSNCAVHES